MQKLYYCFFVFFLLLGGLNLNAGTYSGGTGSAVTPYLITNTADLIELSNTSGDWAAGKYFEQTANITFDANEQLVDWDGDASADWDAADQLGFSPIGTGGTQFRGSFNGNNYTISNLFINRSSTNYLALFGYTNTGASLTGIRLIDVVITGSEYIGSLVGINFNCTILNCNSSGVVNGVNIVGGLVGQSMNTSVINSCYSECSVSGGGVIGGLVGQHNQSTIQNSYTTGNVVGTATFIGGLVGYNSDHNTIINCYSTGNVTGNQNVGGLIGENHNVSTIDNCYATGAVSGTFARVGGFVGLNNSSATITKCFSTGNVSGSNDYTGGFVGANSSSSISKSYCLGTVTRIAGSNTTYGGFCGSNNSTIQYSYSASKVYESVGTIWNVGGNKDKGFIGLNSGVSATNNFYDTEFSGQTSGAGATSKTTSEMKTEATFTGWDFTAPQDWNIQIGAYISYPYLQVFTYDTPGDIPEVNPIPGLEQGITAPSAQASNLYFSGVSRTGMTLNWTNGDGTQRLAMVKLSAISAAPLIDGQSYAANAIYGSGAPINGGYCIYNGVGSSVPVTGLTKYKLYYFRVFEYNEYTPGATLYLQTTNATNPSSRWTLRKEGEEPGLNPNSAFSIYPNPTVALINYSFELSEAANVISELYTSEGRLVKSLNHGALLAGEQKLSIGVNELPNGVYMLQIRMGEESMLGIVEIVK